MTARCGWDLSFTNILEISSPRIYRDPWVQQAQFATLRLGSFTPYFELQDAIYLERNCTLRPKDGRVEFCDLRSCRAIFQRYAREAKFFSMSNATVLISKILQYAWWLRRLC
jgi:hypothetical protein